ncbi:MAG: hypothetical protein KatS3mg109_1026 [Pirellulaceae bacterium]|nr:MAG: hypothetical protein KatS3mg109_1026 [Pirellulaceae bacterium]
MSATVCQRRVSLGLSPGSPKPRLYDCTAGALRLRHYSRRTEQAYIHWFESFAQFDKERHPRTIPDRRHLQNSNIRMAIRMAQEILSYTDVRTHMIHAHIRERVMAACTAPPMPCPARYVTNGNSLSRIAM